MEEGSCVVIKGHACLIRDMSTLKVTRRGVQKVPIIGLDIFSGKKLEYICPIAAEMDVQNVEYIDYELMGFSLDGLACFD